MPEPSPLLSTIVISYNTRQMTLDCLRALQDDLTGISSETIVVDNNSSDGSAAAIAAEFPAVIIIENSANRGFGAANNQGMRAAAGQFFLLINSDAFPKPGAISAMLQLLRNRPDVALVGPRLLNADGSLQRSCFRFPSPRQAWLENLWITPFLPSSSAWGDYRRWPHDQEREVDFVIGACLMVRRSAVEQVGGFDEEFFMYSEEADWQIRLSQAGWKVLFTPAASVTHLGGASGAAEKSRINRYFFDSLDYYEWKHHGLSGLVLVRLAMIIGCTARAAGWMIGGVIPGKAKVARAKLKLRLWLIWRQMTNWRILNRRRTNPAPVSHSLFSAAPSSERK